MSVKGGQGHSSSNSRNVGNICYHTPQHYVTRPQQANAYLNSHSMRLTKWPLGDVNIIWDALFSLVIDSWSICCETALIKMSLGLTGDKSTLVQVMTWCRQAANHYLYQCCPSSMTPYGVYRGQQLHLWGWKRKICPCTICPPHVIKFVQLILFQIPWFSDVDI